MPLSLRLGVISDDMGPVVTRSLVLVFDHYCLISQNGGTRPANLLSPSEYTIPQGHLHEPFVSLCDLDRASNGWFIRSIRNPCYRHLIPLTESQSNYVAFMSTFCTCHLYQVPGPLAGRDAVLLPHATARHLPRRMRRGNLPPSFPTTPTFICASLFYICKRRPLRRISPPIILFFLFSRVIHFFARSLLGFNPLLSETLGTDWSLFIRFRGGTDSTTIAITTQPSTITSPTASISHCRDPGSNTKTYSSRYSSKGSLTIF